MFEQQKLLVARGAYDGYYVVSDGGYKSVYRYLCKRRERLVGVLESLQPGDHAAYAVASVRFFHLAQRISAAIPARPDQQEPQELLSSFFSSSWSNPLKVIDPHCGFLRPASDSIDLQNAVYTPEFALHSNTTVPVFFTHVAHCIHNMDSLQTIFVDGKLRLQGANRETSEQGTGTQVRNAKGNLGADAAARPSSFQGMDLLWFGPVPDVDQCKALQRQYTPLPLAQRPDPTEREQFHSFTSPPFDASASRYGSIRITVPVQQLRQQYAKAVHGGAVRYFVLGTRVYKAEWCHSVLWSNRQRVFAPDGEIPQLEADNDLWTQVPQAERRATSSAASSAAAAAPMENDMGERCQWHCTRSNLRHFSNSAVTAPASVASSSAAAPAAAASFSSSSASSAPSSSVRSSLGGEGWDHLDFALDLSAAAEQTLVLTAECGTRIDFATHGEPCVPTINGRTTCIAKADTIPKAMQQFLNFIKAKHINLDEYEAFFEPNVWKELQTLKSKNDASRSRHASGLQRC